MEDIYNFYNVFYGKQHKLLYFLQYVSHNAAKTCLNLLNMYFGEMCLLLSWIFRIINFESGCLSFNKAGDLVSCVMDANFRRPSQRKIPPSSSFTFKLQNLELLSLKLVKWNSNCWLSLKVFRLPLTRSASKVTR